MFLHKMLLTLKRKTAFYTHLCHENYKQNPKITK